MAMVVVRAAAEMAVAMEAVARVVVKAAVAMVGAREAAVRVVGREAVVMVEAAVVAWREAQMEASQMSSHPPAAPTASCRCCPQLQQRRPSNPSL